MGLLRDHWRIIKGIFLLYRQEVLEDPSGGFLVMVVSVHCLPPGSLAPDY